MPRSFRGAHYSPWQDLYQSKCRGHEYLTFNFLTSKEISLLYHECCWWSGNELYDKLEKGQCPQPFMKCWYSRCSCSLQIFCRNSQREATVAAATLVPFPQIICPSLGHNLLWKVKYRMHHASEIFYLPNESSWPNGLWRSRNVHNAYLAGPRDEMKPCTVENKFIKRIASEMNMLLVYVQTVCVTYFSTTKWIDPWWSAPLTGYYTNAPAHPTKQQASWVQSNGHVRTQDRLLCLIAHSLLLRRTPYRLPVLQNAARILKSGGGTSPSKVAGKECNLSRAWMPGYHLHGPLQRTRAQLLSEPSHIFPVN